MRTYYTETSAFFNEQEPDFEYLIYKICYHAAPTLMGHKPASLIVFKNSKKWDLKDIWLKYQHRLLDVIAFDFKVLNQKQNCIHVLFYRKSWLESIILNGPCKAYLKSIGYQRVETIEDVFYQLKVHFETKCPHEIGILLGYPLSDVIAFSEQKTHCLFTGYWKVYSNMECAKRQFDLYDKAKETINQALQNNISPFQLLSSVS